MPALVVLDDLHLLCPSSPDGPEAAPGQRAPALAEWLADALDEVLAPRADGRLPLPGGAPAWPAACTCCPHRVLPLCLSQSLAEWPQAPIRLAGLKPPLRVCRAGRRADGHLTARIVCGARSRGVRYRGRRGRRGAGAARGGAAGRLHRARAAWRARARRAAGGSPARVRSQLPGRGHPGHWASLAMPASMSAASLLS